MKKYEKPYVKEMGIEVDPVLAGSQVIESNDVIDNPTTGEDDVPAKKFDVWE
ncbi:MAG: hypothetical protein IJK42_13670 [Prevotella sp.]|nr:hypothetical protein [Prevotella sp.]MBQ6210796.1 hypothetical protein [Prevotella sp.]